MMSKINLFLLCFIVLCIPGMAMAQQDWCGTQTLYFQHNESTSPAGYEELINFPSGNPQVDENITITSASGPVLIDAYIMPEGSMADVTALLKGLRVFTTFHYVSTAAGTTRINFTAFQRFANGTEIVFYSQLTDDIDSLTATDYTTYRVSQQDFPVGPTDRLGIKIYGQTTHPSPVTLHFIYQGTTNTSHFESGYFVCGGGVQSAYYVPYTKTPMSPVIPMLGVVVAIMLIVTIRKRE